MLNRGRQGSAYDAEKMAWIRLSRTEGIGPVRMAQLISRFGSAQSAVHAFPSLKSFQNMTLPSVAKIDDEIAAAHNAGAQLICMYEDEYPDLLRMIADPPSVLSVRGDVSLLSMRGVGIVGTRNASLNGRKMTNMLAQQIGQADYSIISGMARGIDTAAHEAALSANVPTIAVIAGGVDDVYPRENEKLYHAICEKGAVISEMPWGTRATAKLFPKRNRIVSGLSLAVIVIEAALRSGSLITARLAGEQGREVFAVPGSPLDGRAAGPNSLIQQGAKLIVQAQDVIDDIASMSPRPIRKMKPKALDEIGSKPKDTQEKLFSDVAQDDVQSDNLEAVILSQLSPAPIDINELIRCVNAAPSAVQTALMMLEMEQKVERIHGNRVALCA